MVLPTSAAPPPPRGETPNPVQTLGLIDVAGMINSARLDGRQLKIEDFQSISSSIRESMNARADTLSPEVERILRDGRTFSTNIGDRTRPEGIIIHGQVEGHDARVTIPVALIGTDRLKALTDIARGRAKFKDEHGIQTITEDTLDEALLPDLRRALNNCHIEIEWDQTHTESMEFHANFPNKTRDIEWGGRVRRGNLEERIYTRESINNPGKGVIAFRTERANYQTDHIERDRINFDGTNRINWLRIISYGDPADARNALLGAEYRTDTGVGWQIDPRFGIGDVAVRDAEFKRAGIVIGGHDVPDIRRVYHSAAGAIPVSPVEIKIEVSTDACTREESYRKAIALIDQGGTQNVHGAIAELESLRARFDAEASLHTALALAYGRDGDYARCLLEYQAALKINPENPDAGIITPQQGEDVEATYNRLHHEGQELLKLGQPLAALRYYEAAVAVKGGGHLAPWSLFDKGVALSQLHLYEEAAQQLLDVRGLLPGNTWVDSRIGMVYEAWGKRDEAKSFYEAALAIDPTNSEAKEGLGRLK